MSESGVSNTSLSHCPKCGEKLVMVSTGPLPGCPQGVSSRQCPTDPAHLWDHILNGGQEPEGGVSEPYTDERAFRDWKSDAMESHGVKAAFMAGAVHGRGEGMVQLRLSAPQPQAAPTCKHGWDSRVSCSECLKEAAPGDLLAKVKELQARLQDMNEIKNRDEETIMQLMATGWTPVSRAGVTEIDDAMIRDLAFAEQVMRDICEGDEDDDRYTQSDNEAALGSIKSVRAMLPPLLSRLRELEAMRTNTLRNAGVTEIDDEMDKRAIDLQAQAYADRDDIPLPDEIKKVTWGYSYNGYRVGYERGYSQAKSEASARLREL
jgi:hypothetical protein